MFAAITSALISYILSVSIHVHVEGKNKDIIFLKTLKSLAHDR